MKRVCPFALLLLAVSFAGCDAVSPTRVSPVMPPPVPARVTLRVFTDPVTDFSTSDLRDAQDQIVQFNTANELIWAADGTRLPGFLPAPAAAPNNIQAEKACACWLEVRFGTQNGERRAYVTADYGHDNPGSVVDLDVVNSALVVRRTEVYPPGTFTLSGVVTEATTAGVVPVEGATVYRGYGTGWQEATTGADGSYKILGLYERVDEVAVHKDGYDPAKTQLAITGDTRFDIRLVRR